MRRQIPFKVSIRQPIRTLIFILLVGLASFGFVSRAVEYIILNREINRIEEFYRTVGTLIPIDPQIINNVYPAAEIIGNSPFVEFEDRRTLTQGVMHDIFNIVGGSHVITGDILGSGHQPFSYKGLYPFDNLIIVEMAEFFTRQVRSPIDESITFLVSASLYPQQVLHGRQQFSSGRPVRLEFELDEHGYAPFGAFLEMGNHYMARVVTGRFGSAFFFPVYDDVYFVCMQDETAVEKAMAAIAYELPIAYENKHMLMLTGTKDMTALPFVQSGVYERFQGRFITYQDYLDANPVIVIPQPMDSANTATRVGQTLTLTLRDMRTFESGAEMTPEILERAANAHRVIDNATPESRSLLDLQYTLWSLPYGVEAHWANMPAGYWVNIPSNYEGDWQNYPTIEIEVEIIGTYRIPQIWSLPRWQHIAPNFGNTEVFVPASIIPEGWGIVDAHIVSGQYSFVLSSAGDDVPFMAAYGSKLAELGFTVQFMGEDPTNFLLSAMPIRNSIWVNLLLFAAVLALVLVLTVFIYLRQRYKEFAILRALGISGSSATVQVITPVLIFWLPAVVAASIGAWFFALHQAAASLQILAELDLPTNYGEAIAIMNILDRMRYEAELVLIRAVPELSLIYLLWLCIGLVAAWFGSVFIGTVMFTKQSMISLIQNANGGGAPVRMVKETAPPEGLGARLADMTVVLLMQPSRSVINKIKSGVRHHIRHILRAPVKSLLVVLTALLFIISLGWLDNTIEFTEQEIERLYATTEITGEIVSPSTGIDTALWGHNIPPTSLAILTNSDFVADYYTTALIRRGLFSPMPDGYIACENTHEVTTMNQAHMDIIKTISCLDTFIHNAARPAAFGLGLTGDFSISFAPGFSPQHFIYSPYVYELTNDTTIPPIPVIVHESLLTRNFMYNPDTRRIIYVLDDGGSIISQSLSFGDEFYLVDGFTATRLVVIGTYTGGHPTTAYHMGQGLVLVPDRLWSYFSTVTFTINQNKTRYMTEFEEEMNDLLAYRIDHAVYLPGVGYNRWTDHYNHDVLLNDAEFKMVVVPLEESLNLLRILYPVAKVMSFVLAMGLSLLLMLQNAKIVAILRVLGSARYKTRLNLGMEQLIVCITGVAIGFAVVMFMGIGATTAGMLVGIYLAGAAVGTIVGVLVISNKTPLELLQVKE